MKRIFLVFLVVMTCSVFLNAQGISINTDGSVANPSSMLELKSTEKGFLIREWNSGSQENHPYLLQSLEHSGTHYKS